MSKPTTKTSRKPAKRNPRADSKRKPAPASVARAAAVQGGKSPGLSKQARVLAMLQASAGATIEAIVRETGWQPHSVRGFLAGVVRNKLGLCLDSSKGDGPRRYRIVEQAPPKAAERRSKRQAA
jgi:hypothetical protein